MNTNIEIKIKVDGEDVTQELGADAKWVFDHWGDIVLSIDIPPSALASISGASGSGAPTQNPYIPGHVYDTDIQGHGSSTYVRLMQDIRVSLLGGWSAFRHKGVEVAIDPRDTSENVYSRWCTAYYKSPSTNVYDATKMGGKNAIYRAPRHINIALAGKYTHFALGGATIILNRSGDPKVDVDANYKAWVEAREAHELESLIPVDI